MAVVRKSSTKVYVESNCLYNKYFTNSINQFNLTISSKHKMLQRAMITNLNNTDTPIYWIDVIQALCDVYHREFKKLLRTGKSGQITRPLDYDVIVVFGDDSSKKYHIDAKPKKSTTFVYDINIIKFDTLDIVANQYKSYLMNLNQFWSLLYLIDKVPELSDNIKNENYSWMVSSHPVIPINQSLFTEIQRKEIISRKNN